MSPDEVMNKAFDFLEAFEQLTPDEQTEIEALIASLIAGRGIDPYHERPSVDQLLARIRMGGTL